VHKTDTYDIAKSKFYKYIEEESLKIEPKVTIKKGKKYYDYTKRNKWKTEQKTKAREFANALAAGDKYVDDDKIIFQRVDFGYDRIFHSFKDYNFTEFIEDRYDTGLNILNNGYDKDTAITEFIVDRAITMLEQKTDAPVTKIDLIKYDVTDQKETIIKGKKKITKTVNKYKKSSAYKTATKYITSSTATKETAGLFIIGMGLHAAQDQYSHGNITKSVVHVKKNDDKLYDLVDGEWKNKNVKSFTIKGVSKTFKGGKRYNDAINLTSSWIDDLLTLYGDDWFRYDCKK
jgi:hypothetical protein